MSRMTWNVPIVIWAVVRKWILPYKTESTFSGRIVRSIEFASLVQTNCLWMWMICLQPWAVPGILKKAASLVSSFCHVSKVNLLWLSEATGLTIYALTEDLVLTQKTWCFKCDLMVWNHVVKIFYKYPIILLLRSIWQQKSESNDLCVSWDDSSQLYSCVQHLCPATTTTLY